VGRYVTLLMIYVQQGLKTGSACFRVGSFQLIGHASLLAYADVVLPEGVDPSFLAALPENIRQEVIMEQLRLQRIQQRAQQVQQEAQSLGVTEVNPEFLAALPPHIQEEVRCRHVSVCFMVIVSIITTTAD